MATRPRNVGAGSPGTRPGRGDTLRRSGQSSRTVVRRQDVRVVATASRLRWARRAVSNVPVRQPWSLMLAQLV
jgi:hypothetical protein